MKLTEAQIEAFRDAMRGRTNFVADDRETLVARGMPQSAADLAPFLSTGLLTREELEKGKLRYVVTAAGRALLGSGAVDDQEIRDDARRAYLMFRGAGDIGATPAWEHLSDAMQDAFANVYRTAVVDSERRFKHTQKIKGQLRPK